MTSKHARALQRSPKRLEIEQCIIARRELFELKLQSYKDKGQKNILGIKKKRPKNLKCGYNFLYN
jgi:hypothetical protein